MARFDNFEEAMDFAIFKEIEARRFYLELAEWVEKQETAEVFEKLANEELAHKSRLEELKQGRGWLEHDDVASLQVTDELETRKPKVNIGYVDALVLGIKREEASSKLYNDLAKRTSSPALKNVFGLLAEEEARHKLKLEVEYDLATF